MPYITCEICSNLFYAKPHKIQRGKSRYCSMACYSKSRQKLRVTLNCAQCKNEFQRKPSAMFNSKSGMFFCSRLCKDAAQRIGGIEAIMPPHYGTGNGQNDYRARALAHYGSSCTKCGFSNIYAIEVHHKDKDRTNNRLDNLEVICANCHCIAHFEKQN